MFSILFIHIFVYKQIAKLFFLLFLDFSVHNKKAKANFSKTIFKSDCVLAETGERQTAYRNGVAVYRGFQKGNKRQ